MPVFTILVILGAALLWLLCSFIFFPLGKLAYRLGKDAKDAMNKDDRKEDEETKENEKE